MDVNFGKRPPFTIGVEEEFQLVDRTSYELVSRFDEIEEELDRSVEVKPELVQSVLEVATHVHGSVPEAIEEARDLRRRIADAARESGTLVVGAGTHPFSRYEHQDVTDKERYRDLLHEMQWIGQREVIFGLHVHVGLSTGQEAVSVAGALRTWLPELLALSANSPFWLGRDTGLASTRSKVFDAFPRSGLPPAYASFEEWEEAMERAQRLGFFDDYTYIWWDLRLHPTLGTIEIRICDGQTRLASVAGIVALVQCLVAMLSDRFEREGALAIQPRDARGREQVARGPLRARSDARRPRARRGAHRPRGGARARRAGRAVRGPARLRGGARRDRGALRARRRRRRAAGLLRGERQPARGRAEAGRD